MQSTHSSICLKPDPQGHLPFETRINNFRNMGRVGMV